MTMIVTHANGFLGCFTQESDGTLRQRALIDTGSDAPTPQELAELGNRLALEYHWDGTTSVPTTRKPKALPTTRKPKALPVKRGYTKPGTTNEPPLPERLNVIRRYLAKQPGTLRDIIEDAGIGFDTNVNGRWHHYTKALLASGEIVESGARSNPHHAGKGATIYALASPD